MDERKLDTMDLLAMGITSIPAPETDIPDNRPHISFSFWNDEDLPTPEKIKAEVLGGNVVYCSEYYGIPYLWQDGNVFRGCLLQYRNVTENPTFELNEIDEAVKWFIHTAESCAG